MYEFVRCTDDGIGLHEALTAPPSNQKKKKNLLLEI